MLFINQLKSLIQNYNTFYWITDDAVTAGIYYGITKQHIRTL